MRYRVTLQPSAGAEPADVTIIEQENGTLSATVDGRPVALDVVVVGGQFSVRADGKVVDLTARGIPPDLSVVAGDLRGRALVEGDRTRSPAIPSKASTLPKTVCSPMPGRVIRVAVQAGDGIREGQTLVVLEAMKMENEVHAAQAGTVLEVHVSPGAAVEANAKLVTLIGTVP